MSQRWYVALKPQIERSNINDLRRHLHRRDPHGKQLGNPMRLPGNLLDPRVLHPCGRTEAPLLHPKRQCKFAQPKQLSLFLVSKDTFYPEFEVKSIYLHDPRRELPDIVMEGDQGWVSRATPQRPENFHSSVSTYLRAKQQSIAKKLVLMIRAVILGEHVDLVEGDLNGTAWRCSNRINISTIEEFFADYAAGPFTIVEIRFDSRMLG